MARTVEECDQMIEAAKNADRLLAVGHLRRFAPVAKLIRDWIQAERLGKLKSFRFLEGQAYRWPVVSDSFFRREIAGGGVLIDRGAHTLDLLLWWAGPVAELDYSDDAAGGVEANCVIRMKTEAGASGYVQLSWDWPLANQYLFNFEKGWLLYTYDVVAGFQWGWHDSSTSQRVVIEDDVRLGFDHLPKANPVTSDLVSCFELQLRNVLAAIAHEEKLVCPGSEARNVIALIEKCYRERRALRQPWLPKTEQSKFETLGPRVD
jgi:predicted dehydrogenase